MLALSTRHLLSNASALTDRPPNEVCLLLPTCVANYLVGRVVVGVVGLIVCPGVVWRVPFLCCFCTVGSKAADRVFDGLVGRASYLVG